MPAGFRSLKIGACLVASFFLAVTIMRDAVRTIGQGQPLDMTPWQNNLRSEPLYTGNAASAIRAWLSRLSSIRPGNVAIPPQPADSSFSAGALISATPTQISDIFISVKTSGKFHKSRLRLLLDTWVPLAKGSAHIFTDVDDPEVHTEATGVELINTHCPAGHNRQHLSCKLGVELHTYLHFDKRWFCHVDDDNYLNVDNLLLLLRNYSHESDWYLGKSSLGRPMQLLDPIEKDHYVALWFATGGAGFCISQSLARKITPYVVEQRLSYWSDRIHLPDDCTLGYIVCHLAHRKFTEVSGLHSHLEGLWALNDNNIGQQITFSYGFFEDKDRNKTPNIVSVKGSAAFNITDDPTRLLTAHCLMFPSTPQCDAYRVSHNG